VRTLKKLFLLILFIASCNTIERTRTQTERIDTVFVSVPRASYALKKDVILSDTVLIEDEKLSIKLIRFHYAAAGDSITVIAAIKPDTALIPIEQKTITIKEKDTKIIKEKPLELYLIIVFLIAFIVIIIRVSK